MGEADMLLEFVPAGASAPILPAGRSSQGTAVSTWTLETACFPDAFPTNSLVRPHPTRPSGIPELDNEPRSCLSEKSMEDGAFTHASAPSAIENLRQHSVHQHASAPSLRSPIGAGFDEEGEEEGDACCTGGPILVEQESSHNPPTPPGSTGCESVFAGR